MVKVVPIIEYLGSEEKILLERHRSLLPEPDVARHLHHDRRLSRHRAVLDRLAVKAVDVVVGLGDLLHQELFDVRLTLVLFKIAST